MIEDLELGCKRYRPYIPTIPMPNSSYFPSFGDEKVVHDERQGQMVVTDKISIPATYITNDIPHYEIAMKESFACSC